MRDVFSNEDSRAVRRQTREHVEKRAASMRGTTRPTYKRSAELTEAEKAFKQRLRDTPPIDCPNNCGLQFKPHGMKLHLKRCDQPCGVEGCQERMHGSLGLCEVHYTVHKNVREHGLSVWTYIELYNAHDGKCAICKTDAFMKGSKIARGPGMKNKVICIDHDHATGRVRGLLCHPCNIALGYLRDDVTRLRAAIEYLESP